MFVASRSREKGGAGRKLKLVELRSFLLSCSSNLPIEGTHRCRRSRRRRRRRRRQLLPGKLPRRALSVFERVRSPSGKGTLSNTALGAAYDHLLGRLELALKTKTQKRREIRCSIVICSSFIFAFNFRQYLSPVNPYESIHLCIISPFSNTLLPQSRYTIQLVYNDSWPRRNESVKSDSRKHTTHHRTERRRPGILRPHWNLFTQCWRGSNLLTNSTASAFGIQHRPFIHSLVYVQLV